MNDYIYERILLHGSLVRKRSYDTDIDIYID